jgi:hypothetical protein
MRSWPKGTDSTAAAHQGMPHTRAAEEVARAMRRPNRSITPSAIFARQGLGSAVVGFAYEIMFAARAARASALRYSPSVVPDPTSF